MQFSIRELAAKGVPVEFHQSISTDGLVQGRKDIVSIESMRADLVAQPMDEVIDVAGQLSVNTKMLCSRCLKETAAALEIPFHEQFRRSEETGESEADEEDINIVEADKVDLIPYVEEALLMNLPYAPLCEESCKGLCSECGQDRNEQTCSCDTVPIDPRLAELKRFFEK